MGDSPPPAAPTGGAGGGGGGGEGERGRGRAEPPHHHPASTPLSPSCIYNDESSIGSTLSKAAAHRPRIRFLPYELPAGVSTSMETHDLTVESPGATLERKKQGGGIVYFPPEDLAEYLDSSLATPVSGGSSARCSTSSASSTRGGRKCFDERNPPNDVGAPSKDGAKPRISNVHTRSLTSSTESMMFYCAFCMRNRPGTNRGRFEGNGGCSHEFCKECLEDYLFQRIVVRHHSLHPCPKFGEEACRASASSEDVRCIVRPDVYEQHSRRLEGLSGACEECGHQGRRPSSRSLLPPPPPPPPSSSTPPPPMPLPSPSSPHSSREPGAAATAATADPEGEDSSTCPSCGSALKRHHYHLPHHHSHHIHHNNRSSRLRHDKPAAPGTEAEAGAGKGVETGAGGGIDTGAGCGSGAGCGLGLKGLIMRPKRWSPRGARTSASADAGGGAAAAATVPLAIAEDVDAKKGAGKREEKGERKEKREDGAGAGGGATAAPWRRRPHPTCGCQ